MTRSRVAWLLLAAAVACACASAWALVTHAEAWDAWTIAVPYQVGAALAIVAVGLAPGRRLGWLVAGMYVGAFLFTVSLPVRDVATAVVRAAFLVGMER